MPWGSLDPPNDDQIEDFSEDKIIEVVSSNIEFDGFNPILSSKGNQELNGS